MQRRAFTAGMAAAAWPGVVRAQPNGIRVVGMLMGFESGRASQGLVAEFRKTLARLGWSEGSNLRIELRWGNGNLEQINDFAKELVDLHPHVILAQTTPVARALAKLTKTTPIVFVVVSDPIGSGFATSPCEARPLSKPISMPTSRAPFGWACACHGQAAKATPAVNARRCIGWAIRDRRTASWLPSRS